MSYYNYRPSPFSNIPLAVKNLLIINGLFFLATMVFDASFRVNLIDVLGLHYWTSSEFKPHQVITHMFMHSGFGHIFSNMFALWMFGATLEHRWGPKRFIFFYLFTALGAAILHQTVTGIEIFRAQGAIDFFTANPTVDNFVAAIKAAGFTPDTTYIGGMRSIFTSGVIENKAEVAEFTQSLNALLVKKSNIPTVGASGAVFGVLIAFALYQPNTELFMFFIPFPIKAKYFVGFYAAMELYLGIQNNPGDSVAHFAHLGGALFGYILVKYWNKSNRNSFY